ncbi:MAG: dehydrogenase [Candidatus Hydrogenedentota bacterium]
MNLAIIGCGVMGQYHAPCAQKAGFRIAAVGDPVRSKADALGAEYGAEATDDCLSLCSRKDVDAVLVATPTPTHAPYVVAAARDGKHVFCEKPFARTLEQCDEAMEAVTKAGVKLFIGHVVRYFHEFVAIKQQIDAGKVGRAGFVRTYRGGLCPKGEGNWFRDWAQSGGVTLDCIIHDFDWLRFAFGEVQRVFAQNLRERTADGIDYAMVTLRMKSGIIATTTGSWAHPSGFRVKVEVCGDNGMLQFDSAEAAVTSMMRETAGGAAGVVVPSSPVAESAYQLEWHDFRAWLEDGREPKVKPEDGVEAVRIALAALESAETGQPVTL